MNCPSCSTEAAPGANRCAKCKTALPPSCHGCGKPVIAGEDLCIDCRTDPVTLVGGPIPHESEADVVFAPKSRAAQTAAGGRIGGEKGKRGVAAGGAKSMKRAHAEDVTSVGSEPRGSTATASAAISPAPSQRVEESPGDITQTTVTLPPVPPPTAPPPVAQPAVTQPAALPPVTPAGATQVTPPPTQPSPLSAMADSVLGATTTPASVPAAPPVPRAVGADHSGRHTDLDMNPRLIGRSGVLEQLRALVERAATEREVVFAALTGQPGMGKSRLARELAPAVHKVLPEARVLLARCGSRGAPPFTVFSRLFAARFGIADDDTHEAVRTKVESQVAELIPAGKAAEVAELIARLVLPAPPPSDPGVVPPVKSAQQEARTFIAVRRFLAAEAEHAPLVLIFDDVHRAAAETVKLIHFLAAGLEGLPVVLLVVGRTHLFTEHPSFAQESELERIEIGPLSSEESGELFEELTKAAGEPPLALAKHARERLGGAPRALVELLRYLLETGGIKKIGQRYTFDRMRFARTTLAAGSPGLPGTIEELLEARLQLVEPARRDLLEKAAACGPIFWLDAVVALVRAAASADPEGPSLEEIAAAGERAREEVQGALDAMEKRGIVVSQQHSRIPGESEYHFAYPPWWEVVEKGVAPQARRRYHKLVAQWLELRPEGRGEAAQEEVAKHLERAGDGDGAALRYQRAADRARSLYYNHEAIRLYSRALACIGETEIAARITLWHDLGSVYQLTGEHENALRALEKMLRLAYVVASRPKLAVAFNKIGRILRQKGELKRALDHFERGLEMFRQNDDERGIAGSLDDMAQVLWLLGRYEAALDRGAAALERRRRLGDKASIALSLLTIGHIERHRGLFHEADSCYREALALRRGLDDRQGIAAVLNGMGALAFQRGDFTAARTHWEEALGHAAEVGALPLVAVIEAHLGEIARALGDAQDARGRFERSEAAARTLDDKRLLSEALRNLSGLDLAAGDSERALERAEKAFELADHAGIRVDAGRALIALGEIHAQTLFHADEGEQGGSAADYFKRAVDLFREIGNEAELGVALERAGTYRIERGEIAEGRALIGEAEAIFNKLGMRVFGDSARRVMRELE